MRFLRFFRWCAVLSIPLVALACASPDKSVKKESPAPAQELQQEGVRIAEFIIGAGDELSITVYRHDELSRKIWVPPDGKVFMPLAGEVQAGGKSIRELRDDVTQKLSSYLVNPQVSIEVTSFKGQKFFVLGEVRSPGVYQIDSAVTVLEAISRAGGMTLDGEGKTVMLIRGREALSLNLEKALKDGDLTQNVGLLRGDVVYVPRTLISDVDRFFKHFENILRPIVLLEQGIALYPKVEDVLTGGAERDRGVIIITEP